MHTTTATATSTASAADNLRPQIVTSSNITEWCRLARAAGLYPTLVAAREALDIARAKHAQRAEMRSSVTSDDSGLARGYLAKTGLAAARRASLASAYSRVDMRGHSSRDPHELTIRVSDISAYEDGYWGKCTWTKRAAITVTVGASRVGDLARAAKLNDGASSKLHLVALDRDGNAIWAQRRKGHDAGGLSIEHGVVLVASDGSLVHALDRATAESIVARRNKSLASHGPKKAPTYAKATIRLARRLGLCREGILAWCESHGVDPAGSLTKGELLAIDPNNYFVQRVADRLR